MDSELLEDLGPFGTSPFASRSRLSNGDGGVDEITIEEYRASFE